MNLYARATDGAQRTAADGIGARWTGANPSGSRDAPGIIRQATGSEGSN